MGIGGYMIPLSHYCDAHVYTDANLNRKLMAAYFIGNLNKPHMMISMNGGMYKNDVLLKQMDILGVDPSKGHDISSIRPTNHYQIKLFICLKHSGETLSQGVTYYCY